MRGQQVCLGRWICLGGEGGEVGGARREVVVS